MRRLSEAPLDLIAANVNDAAAGDGGRSPSVVSWATGNGVSRRFNRSTSTSPTASIGSPTSTQGEATVGAVMYLSSFYVVL